MLGMAMIRKRSSGEMAVALALRIPYLSQLRYLQRLRDAYGKLKLVYLLPVMALEIEVLCAGYPVGDEDLSYIMRFGRGGIAVDNVLQLTCKHLADRVARKGCDFFRRQNDDNRPSDVAGRLCAHPRIIALCVFTRRDCLRFRRGFGIVCVRDPLALLDLLVALESKRFDHVDSRSGSEVGASEWDEL